MGVIEAAGDFLAVAGDEGHGRAFVEQADRGDDLRGLRADFLGNGGSDLAGERGGDFGHSMAGEYGNGKGNCRPRIRSATA